MAARRGRPPKIKPPEPPTIPTIPRPEPHYTFRAQHLIRMGEWLERNENLIRLISFDLSNAFSGWIEDPEDGSGYMQGLQTSVEALNDLQLELRRLKEDRSASKVDGSLSIIHRYACLPHRETVLIPPYQDGIDPGTDND